ncbi:HTH domain-containing protein [Streptomyces sp. DH20]|uniref:HTH domain-containing protein n=1 Tax=Streptomyces sp. DH20 TaxID=2857009 RepID=UPI001E4AF35B|nr:HTH domain-containing protein [Streptomyces sp. DH20]
MTRADRLKLVRQLRDEGLSQRAIAKRLKVSKDTVRRDFERLDAEGAPDDEPGDEPPAMPDDEAAPQVSQGDQPDSGEDGAPGDEPPGEPVAQLPRRVRSGRLEMDLSHWPGLRRDLALLAQTGCTAEELVATAVRVLAVGYQQGLAAGVVQPGLPFNVTRMSVGPLPLPARATADA